MNSKAIKKAWDLWLNDATSAADIFDIVNHAKNKYEGTKKSKASNVWSSFSSKIVYYKDILDVLVQHHSEYVSLAWGAMKFLFVVSLPHRQLCGCLILFLGNTQP